MWMTMLSPCLSFLVNDVAQVGNRTCRKRGMVTKSRGGNLRHGDGLQVQTGSICALLTHLENKSHMENDSSLF